MIMIIIRTIVMGIIISLIMIIITIVTVFEVNHNCVFFLSFVRAYRPSTCRAQLDKVGLGSDECKEVHEGLLNIKYRYCAVLYYCVTNWSILMLCCAVLYSAVLHYIVLRCTVLYCIVLRCTVLYCAVLCCIVL